MQVAILAGGRATRLGSLARHQPKALVKVDGKPFVEYQLDYLRRSGVESVVMCLGHLGDQIERHLGDGTKFGLNITYSYEDQPLGTAGALKKAGSLLQNVFFTLYGDSYLFIDFGAVLAYFEAQGNLALMTVFKNEDRYDRSNTAVEGKLVKRFSKVEKPPDMVYVEYGANVFRKKVLDMIPATGFYRLEELFPRLIARGQLLALEMKERFYEIGSPQGLKEFGEYIKGAR